MPSALLAGQIEAIRIIDKKIDGISLELLRRTRVAIFDARSWQLGWDRHPDLAGRREALFRFRGCAQATRDAILDREHRDAQRLIRRANSRRQLAA
jgi:hypothetical protein